MKKIVGRPFQGNFSLLVVAFVAAVAVVVVVVVVDVVAAADVDIFSEIRLELALGC